MARRKRRESLAKPKENQHEVDIVIPVYGRSDLLRECLKAVEVAGLDVDYQLIVVDDCSPNQAEMDMVYNALPKPATKLLKNRENRGFAATANRGASVGRAPAILFLNSDVMLQGGAIRAMLKTLWSESPPEGIIGPEDSQVGIVGPKLLFPENSATGERPAGKIQHAGVAFNGAAKPFHILIGWSADNPKANIKRCVQAVTGACLMTKRQTWDAVWRSYRAAGDPSQGGFNESYGRGAYEDIEFCLAARGEGFKTVYEPAAVGYHHVGASVSQLQEGYPLNRNEAIFKARCGHLIIWDEWAYW